MLVATFRLSHGAVALETAFDEVPGMLIEAERIAAHSTRWTMPCIWVAANDPSVDEALANDPSVDEVVAVTEFGDERYYQVDWDDTVETQVDEYLDKEGSILNAEATTDGWELRIRFASRNQFDAFRAKVRERGHSFELLNIYEPGTPHQSIGDVTPRQRDALVAAVDRGYYEVPRRISARELTADLEMSHQSLSELLRRGTENIVAATLRTTAGVEPPEGGEDR
jgi:predicted DNA binding protein